MRIEPDYCVSDWTTAAGASGPDHPAASKARGQRWPDHTPIAAHPHPGDWAATAAVPAHCFTTTQGARIEGKVQLRRIARNDRPRRRSTTPSTTDSPAALVVGPAETKTDLVNHVRDKGPKPLVEALLGVEAMDHPSDAELQAFGLKRFREHDRKTANSPTFTTDGRQAG